ELAEAEHAADHEQARADQHGDRQILPVVLRHARGPSNPTPELGEYMSGLFAAIKPWEAEFRAPWTRDGERAPRVRRASNRTATMSSAYECASAAAAKTPSLAMNPAVGGMPAWASRKKASSAAITGRRRPNAFRSPIECRSSRPPSAVTTANAPIVMNEYTSR